jgi:sugar transferase (PEP-CTERM/EpsH1 system associated)
MRILFLAHRLPYPPDTGDKIRSFQVLKHLASQHEVYLACLLDKRCDERAVTELRKIVPNVLYAPISRLQSYWRMLWALLTDKPLTVSHFHSKTLHQQIAKLVAQVDFDAIYVYSSTMAAYVLDYRIPLRVIDFCDLDSAKFKQYAMMNKPPMSWLYRLESQRLADYEKQIAAHFDHIIFIGPEEKRLFDSNGFSHKVKLIGNGVEFNFYDRHLLASSQRPSKDTKPYLLFTGTMDYLPNVDAAYWFAREVFPTLKMVIPELQFYIVGNNPARKIRQLHNPKSAIFVTGYVEDVRPYLKNARVFVAPMRIARGMQTKILEAMACGVPVVTSRTAARGIGARAGKEVLIADTAAAYARKTLQLLLNKKIRHRMRRQAFAFLRQHFDWQQNLGSLDMLLAKSQSHSPREIEMVG